MKKFMYLFMCCWAMILSSCVTEVADLPNFREVEAGVYRGGQPTYDGFMWLSDHEYINTIVKLDTTSEGSDKQATEESINVIYVPITLEQQLGLKPIDSKKLISTLHSLPRYGVYIHCEHGEDRTGLFCAMWRVHFNHWTKAQAEKEMLDNGFHKSLFGLLHYWENFKDTP